MRKDRIDDYYKQLLLLRKKLNSEPEKVKELEVEIEKIRSHAFDALINEKLDADESFNIFLNLYDQIERDLHKINNHG